MCKACNKYTIIKNAKDGVGYLGNPVLLPLYDELELLMVKLFGYQLKDALENIEGLLLLEKEIPIQVEDDITIAVEGILQKVYVAGQDLILASILAELGDLSIDLEGSISIVDDIALEYAEYRAGELIRGVTQTTQEQVAKLVTKAMKDGRSKKYLAEQIYTKFDQYNTVRSALIAHQEIALAHGNSSYTQFQDLVGRFGQEGYKRNQTQNDAKVRPEHYDAQLEGWILSSKEFQSTGTLHEPHGFNCRCKVTYRVFKPSENTYTLLPYNSIQQFQDAGNVVAPLF